ncbi:hypothetical protein GCM10023259_103460 [Thermocatellispora tengchongensis]
MEPVTRIGSGFGKDMRRNHGGRGGAAAAGIGLSQNDRPSLAALAAPNVVAFIDPNDPLGVVATTPAWAASTAYALGDLVVNNRAVWRCYSAHTSSASFDTTKWAPTTWIFGTGKSGSPTGYGNADLCIHSDGVHLTAPIGNDYHTRLVFEAIRKILAAN